MWQHRYESQAGAWVRQNSKPVDRLFVWGQGDRQTGMYLDADRRPASRFISPFPLTGHVFGGYPREWGNNYEDTHVLPGAWDTLALDFALHPPRFIIDAEATRPDSRYPIARYPALAELLARNYRPVRRTPDGIIYQRIGAGDLAALGDTNRMTWLTPASDSTSTRPPCKPAIHCTIARPSPRSRSSSPK
jgi:hypothetical protein